MSASEKSPSGDLDLLDGRLAEALALQGEPWWSEKAIRRLEDQGATALPVIWPGLARHVGRGLVGGGITSFPALPGDSCPPVVDLDAWRVCDLAGLRLLRTLEPADEALLDLYAHGDMEERTILLRALTLRPLTAATIELLGEAQRTNTQPHFEAAVCDANLPARALGHGGFEEADLNRLVLKAAFVNLPLARLLGVPECANAELSRMLQGLASEREAAGRPIWLGTLSLIGEAPTQGSVLRVLGGLEHGDDAYRLACARALRGLDLPQFSDLVRDRAGREPRPRIAALLEETVRRWSDD